MSDIEKLIQLVTDFRDERGWKHYHTPKDLAISIDIESSELLELFQWKEEYDDKKKLEEEMADIFIYLLSLADVADVDLKEAVKEKIKKNEMKYPVEETKW